MIGIIVTGHGGFASGLEANMKMLIGEEAKLSAFDFKETMTPEDLNAKLTEACEAYAACEGIVILADLAGGTPYNQAATVSVGNPKVRVISGCNSSMLMELLMHNITGMEITDLDQMCEELMQTGREGIAKFILEMPATDDFDGEDGI